MSKLLLAEDDNFSRDMLSRRLQKSGYEVITAVDGSEAVAAALRHRPDLILLDLDMPVMDGRTAMRFLKTDLRTFRIPIIVLSCHTGSDDVAAALEEGCFAYEAKPVTLRRLVERVQEALQANSRKKPASASGEEPKADNSKTDEPARTGSSTTAEPA